MFLDLSGYGYPERILFTLKGGALEYRWMRRKLNNMGHTTGWVNALHTCKQES